MSESNVLNPQQRLTVAENYSVSSQAIWLVPCLQAGPVHFRFDTLVGEQYLNLSSGWQGLILLNHVNLILLSGQLDFYPIRLEKLTQLLAFIEEAQDVKRITSVEHCVSISMHNFDCWATSRKCEYWLLQEVLNTSSRFSPLLALLRQSESYWLVRFLLAQSLSGEKLQILSQRYGVSNSHFRRLCHTALGKSSKVTLRNWRMARSLLDVLSGKENLSEIAFKNGYASPSHFSNEIKKMIGVSPRGLTEIINQVIG